MFIKNLDLDRDLSTNIVINQLNVNNVKKQPGNNNFHKRNFHQRNDLKVTLSSNNGH
jgi:hypothetical protein